MKDPKAVKWYATGHEFNDLDSLRDRAGWLADRIGTGRVAVLQKKVAK